MKNESLYMILGVLLFVIGYLSAMTIYNLPDKKFLSSEIKDNCNYLNLFMTADCMNKQLTSFYKYNMSNINLDMNLSEFKEIGGVCHDAVNYYYNNIDDRFFKNKLTIETGEKINHEILIISNYEGWCYLDQDYYDCLKFSNSGETNETN